MHDLDFLAALHERLAPPSYLEIGIRHGDSLALARCPAVGIDPAFELHVELRDDVALLRETSDEYFDRDDPLAAFGGEPVAFAFIDGMHLAEFVVRDFANVERNAEWSSVVVFDDILPRSLEEAARDRRSRTWTGDVYKVLDVLARHRPDLTCLRVDTEPTGSASRSGSTRCRASSASATTRSSSTSSRRTRSTCRPKCSSVPARSTPRPFWTRASGRCCARRASAG